MTSKPSNPCIDKFVPLPRRRASISAGGTGWVSLQYDLFARDFKTDQHAPDVKILSEFFENVVNKTPTNIRGDTFAKKTFGSMPSRDLMLAMWAPAMYDVGRGHTPEPVRGMTCVDDMHNVRFTKNFYEAFKEHKKEAFIDTLAKMREDIALKPFYKDFPALKKRILAIAGDKKAPACTDIKYDWNDPMSVELMQFASVNLLKENNTPFFTDPLKAACPGTRNIKRDIIKKIATTPIMGEKGTVLEVFEERKKAEMKAYNESARNLRTLVLESDLDKPFWKKNEDTCYYYRANPHHASMWGGGGIYDPEKDKNSPNLTTRLPAPIEVPLVPVDGWLNSVGKADDLIQTSPMTGKGKCKAVEEFFSPENVAKFTDEDKKLLDYMKQRE